jgi:SAM-dependent methyltransferase
MMLNWDKFNEKNVGHSPISNIQSYINGMMSSHVDKLFFLNIIDPDIIVDFGCANGMILSKINEIKPNVKLVGYDIDQTMISKAEELIGTKATLTTSWSNVLDQLGEYKRPALILSSVIHEVYSYSNSTDIKNFWDNQVFSGDFKWISIRDMIPSVEIHKEDMDKFIDDVQKVRKLSNIKYLRSFESRWGRIDSNYRTFTHYLLKYRFIDNWEREVRENYLPVSLETIYKKIPNDYRILYEYDFILPFLQKKVKEDFDIQLNHTTHTKMVIVNTKFR